MIFNKLVALWGLFFMLMMVGSCQTQTASSIRGRVQLEPGWHPVVYLLQPRSFGAIAANYSGFVIDSARIDEAGDFFFPSIGNTAETLFELCVQRIGSRFPNKLLDENPMLSNYMPIVLQAGEALVIQAKIARFQASFQVLDPSEVNLSLLKVRDIRHESFDKFPREWENVPASNEDNLLEHEAAVVRFQRPLSSFLDTCKQFFPSMVAARWVSPAGDYERVPELLQRLCDQWGGKSPEKEWLMSLCSPEAIAKRPLLIGSTVPNAELPMLAGDTLLLHTLLGSKLTILDIWATWCAPCRKENKAVLAPLWHEYRSKGLQIIAYSIDSNPNSWKTTITKDSLGWPHASHLNGDDAPLMHTLNITTIPANFILDTNGKVVAKNLHGEALRNFVATYMAR